MCDRKIVFLPSWIYCMYMLISRQPLHVMKVKVKKNLQNLELKEMVTRKNHYQDLVNLIAQVGLVDIQFVIDICNQ